MRRKTKNTAVILYAHRLALKKLRIHRVDGELLVLDAVLQERSLEVPACLLEVLDESLILLVSEIVVRLHDSADISALPEEFGTELLLSRSLLKSRSVAAYRVQALDAVIAELHYMKHILVAMQSVQALYLAVYHVHLVPLTPVADSDLDVVRIYLM